MQPLAREARGGDSLSRHTEPAAPIRPHPALFVAEGLPGLQEGLPALRPCAAFYARGKELCDSSGLLCLAGGPEC